MTVSMTYSGSEVNYDAKNLFERRSQAVARETADNAFRLGFAEVDESRWQSAYLMAMDRGGLKFLAHVDGNLGTKNLVADAMYELTGKSYYDQIGQDTVAKIVNNLITVGALPVSTALHLVVGSSDWFLDEQRYRDLIAGWKHACYLARCTWGGTKTAVLREMVDSGVAVLSGSSLGTVWKSNVIRSETIRDGDAIVFIGSSGIHSNGLALARKIADILPAGYLSQLPNGRTYGETLLDPTPIYVPVIEDCQKAGINIHYAVNVAEGWRELMRAPQSFTYVIDRVPGQRPIFEFMQRYGPINDSEAYSNFNMGVGFALFVAKRQLQTTLDAITPFAVGNDLSLWIAGHVENGPRKVVIVPMNIEFTGETLQIR